MKFACILIVVTGAATLLAINLQPGGRFNYGYLDQDGYTVLYGHAELESTLHELTHAYEEYQAVERRTLLDPLVWLLDTDELITMGEASPVNALGRAVMRRDSLYTVVDQWVAARHPKLRADVAQIRVPCRVHEYHLVKWKMPSGEPAITRVFPIIGLQSLHH